VLVLGGILLVISTTIAMGQTAVASNSGPICAGEIVILYETGGDAISWEWSTSGPATFNDNTLQNPTATGAVDDEVFTVVITDAGSNTASSSTTVDVTPLLPVSVSISAVPSGAVCTGTSVTFTATPVNGGTTPSYQWQVNGTDVGTDSPTYTTSALLNNDVVTVVMTSNATCATGSPATSNSLMLTVTLCVTLPTGWEVNPPDFNFSGQITAKVFIDGTAVESGFLAAFVDEECRGIADTAYFPPSDHYVFGLMFYSNNAVGDTLTFKYYDPAEDKIYKMDTSFVFTPDMIAGNAIRPKLMYEGVDYNNTFNVGWNWFSVNARYDDMNLNSVLSSCAMQDDYIKSQDSTATYYSGFGWWGSLDKLSPRDLYKIRVANPCGIEFLGRPVEVNAEVVNIVTGWNWIGYYPQSSLPINNALASLTLTQFDNIKSQEEVSTYYDGFGWFGDLDSLKPAEGYMIKVTLPGTLAYPEISGLKSANVFQEKDDTVFCPDRFEFSGTITAKVVIDGDQAGNEGNLLLAIVNDEIRGIVASHYFAPLDVWLFPLMIHSNLVEGEIVHFRFYDSKNDKFYPCEETLSFKNDMIVADAFKAFELNAKSGTGITEPVLTDNFELKSYPNPFDLVLNIEYRISERAHIRITIYDISGKIIEFPVDQLQEPDRYTVKWDSSKQPAGTYIIKLNAGEKQIIRKVSLVR
jgi:hypothetical protein